MPQIPPVEKCLNCGWSDCRCDYIGLRKQREMEALREELRKGADYLAFRSVPGGPNLVEVADRLRAAAEGK